ncbi:MAG: FAD-binding oxidoreductase [Proteobacteria bacterium]|nr:FAD-binding oxidoreductase [Pseudomonadota bacterium]
MNLIKRLGAIVGPSQVLTDPVDLDPILTDWRGRYHGKALAAVRPASTEEVAAIVRLARETGTVIVPQGGNTGMCAAATPLSGRPSIVVKLDRMKRIRAVSSLGDSIAVDAGCVLAEVQAEAAKAGRLFPLSLGAEGSCQIGGNLSTNAGGTAALRYGVMRDLTLGLEVVLPDGRVLDLMTGLRKDSAGYDLKHWFIGAEGTLGIITGAVLKLFPRMAGRAVALAKLGSIGDVLSFLALARAEVGDRIGAFEVMNREQVAVIAEKMPQVAIPFALDADWFVLIELGDTVADGLPALMERLLERAFDAVLLSDALVAASEAQAQAFWKIRHSVSESSKAAGYVVSHDSAVPLAGQGRFVTEVEARVKALRPDARVVMHGHIGDGNIHILAIIPPVADADERFRQVDVINAIVDEVTRDLRGTISAEHGIGYANIGRLARVTDPVEIDMMRMLKHTLDPDNLLNPGKIFT